MEQTENGNSSYTSLVIGAMRKSEITGGKKVNGQDLGKCLN